jgi:RNA polymerase sigma-70 factor (ECF subfamily)
MVDEPPDLASAALAAPLAEAVAAARASHPGISVPLDGFAAHLLGKLGPGAGAVELQALRAADLYLAFACCRGDAAALLAFEGLLAAEVKIVLARGRGPRLDADDFRQACFERLVTGERPKLLDYAGHGDLESFLRVTLLRLAIDLGRKRTEAPLDDPERPLALPSLARDPELAYLKGRYMAEFQRAFEDAARELSPEERNLLRYHHAEGLSIDQIAGLYRVHRATAARRVVRARDALLGGTRRLLMERLSIRREELESVMRLLESDLHASVQRILA